MEKKLDPGREMLDRARWGLLFQQCWMMTFRLA